MSKKVSITNLGGAVLCDSCNADHTINSKPGGLLFSGYAVCGECEDEWRARAKKHDEEHFILQTCPKDKTFADWVREDIRGGEDGIIKVTSF